MTHEEAMQILHAQLHNILLRVQQKKMAITFAVGAILKAVQTYLHNVNPEEYASEQQILDARTPPNED